MNQRTLKALNGSIAKWEAICNGTGTDEGIENCPLCKLFYKEDCEGCPVSKHTGKICCDDSPYCDFTFSNTNLNNIKPEDRESFLKTAKAELDFLKSLRP